MPSSLPPRSAAIRALIVDFIQKRLEAKLEKLEANDPRRTTLLAEYHASVWLKDAARRVAQIQAVTHSLKPLHPEARGSSLFCDPSELPSLQELGSHALQSTFQADVVGAASALDVYKFLKLTHEGESVLQLSAQADADLGRALCEDPEQAVQWMASFASLSEPRGRLSSHALAKQIFWLVDEDALRDEGFHLLAPLYPTSLVHRVYLVLQDDRFSEDAKEARAARREGRWHDRPVREYPNLAIQKLGGTKPQNISQLNSERRGENYLLASLPPVWGRAKAKPVLGEESLFNVFRSRALARRELQALRLLLESNPPKTLATRISRDACVEALLDDFAEFTFEQRELKPGWSADPQCQLPVTHCAWLDPEGDTPLPEDLLEQMSKEFATWLNRELSAKLPMGDEEFQHWRKQAKTLFQDLEWEGAL